MNAGNPQGAGGGDAAGEPLHRYTWRFADGRLAIRAEGYSAVCTIEGEIAALLVSTVEHLGPAAANAFLAGLFSGGLAASLGAVEVAGVHGAGGA